MKSENLLQAEAIKACQCSDTLKFIEDNGGIFREVIESHKKQLGRLPTSEELIWCASEIAKHNLRENKSGN